MVDKREAGGVEGVCEEVEGRGLVGGLEDVGDVGEEYVGEEISGFRELVSFREVLSLFVHGLRLEVGTRPEFCLLLTFFSFGPVKGTCRIVGSLEG